VATHKYVISFCVGLELVTARTPLKLFAIYMSVFSLVSPIGVGIG
jgi:zinc transporter 1/2/3